MGVSDVCRADCYRRTISLLAHATSSLGRVYGQILWWKWNKVRAVLVQSNFERRKLIGCGEKIKINRRKSFLMASKCLDSCLFSCLRVIFHRLVNDVVKMRRAMNFILCSVIKCFPSSWGRPGPPGRLSTRENRPAQFWVSHWTHEAA